MALETIGAWSAACHGTLVPAVGVMIYPQPPPNPPVIYTGQARPVPSIIESATPCADEAEALAVALAQMASIGQVLTFRGVACMVADCQADHRAAHTSLAGGGVATARWTLLAQLNWVPT